MKTFARTMFKGLLQLLATLMFLVTLVLVALAILGSSETTAARIWYAIGGVIAIPLSIVLLAWSNPKNAEGDFLVILFSLINWPR